MRARHARFVPLISIETQRTDITCQRKQGRRKKHDTTLYPIGQEQNPLQQISIGMQQQHRTRITQHKPKIEPYIKRSHTSTFQTLRRSKKKRQAGLYVKAMPRCCPRPWLISTKCPSTVCALFALSYRNKQVVRHSRRLPLGEGAVQLQQTVEQVGS